MSTDDAPKEELKFKYVIDDVYLTLGLYSVQETLFSRWELLEVPLGYEQQSQLPSGPTLTLDGLTTGRYTVQVTVTDADGASSNATAKIKVEEEKDYPPTANAGEDIIIYLPITEVELHGNQSTDDHGITSWEWTRKQVEGVKELAADSTDMRTAHPHLSKLEEGTYTFILKVIYFVPIIMNASYIV